MRMVLSHMERQRALHSLGAFFLILTIGGVFMPAQATAFEVTSRNFKNGEVIPKQLTCDGENVSPQISWKNAPKETRSFVLICEDPDAPRGTWYHWGLY